MVDLSPSTGEGFYSGSWEDIQLVLGGLDIDEGKLSVLTEKDVNKYQEMVDREIDGILEELYHTPLTAMFRVQPDGTTKSMFPGDLRRAARYWTAALILMNEFQQLSQNTTEQAQQYIDDSRRQIYAMKRYTHRIPGQRRKSHFSRTIPPNFQPPSIPEQDF